MSFDPSPPVRSLRTHALVVRLAFVIAAVFVALVMPLFRWILDLLWSADAYILSSVALILIASAVLVPVLGFAWVSFIVAMNRAHANLEAVGADLRWPRAWIVGGWLIPVVPLLAVSEVDRQSQGRDVSRAPFLGWAVCGSLFVVLGTANVLREFVAHETAFELSAGKVATDLAAGVLFLVAGIAGIVMVNGIAVAQERLIERLPVPFSAPTSTAVSVTLPGS